MDHYPVSDFRTIFNGFVNGLIRTGEFELNFAVRVSFSKFAYLSPLMEMIMIRQQWITAIWLSQFPSFCLDSFALPLGHRESYLCSLSFETEHYNAVTTVTVIYVLSRSGNCVAWRTTMKLMDYLPFFLFSKTNLVPFEI